MPLKIVRSMQKDVQIKHLLHRSLAGMEKPRDSEVVHASDLFKSDEFCPRERAFLDLGLAVKKDEFLGTAMRMTFDHGRDMESRFRNDWVRPLMVGYWECGVCNYLHPVFGKAPKIICPSCGWGHQWRYKEVRVTDPETGVSGGFDGVMKTEDPQLRLFELKSMDKDEHRKLVSPLSEHKVRTALYLYLLERADIPFLGRLNVRVAHILYVSKSFGFKDDSLKDFGIRDSPFSPVKEFRVNRDDSLFETQLNRAKALHVWRFKHHKDPSGLPCGVCANGMTKRAQKCSAVTSCFSGAYPGIITWRENGTVRHLDKDVVA